MTDYTISFNNPNKLPASSILIEKGQVNYQTTLPLFGSGSTEYAENIWENFLHLMENFAHSTAPVRATEGQTWFDKNNNVLRVSTVQTPYIPGSPPTTEVLSWRSVGAPIVGTSAPSGATSMWFNTTDNNTYVFNGTTYQPVGDKYLLRSGGTLTGSLVLQDTLTASDVDVTDTIVVTGAATTFGDNVTFTSQQVLRQEDTTNPIVSYESGSLKVTQENVVLNVAASRTLFIKTNGFNDVNEQTLISFSAGTTFNVPLNVNGIPTAVGSAVQTTSALRYSQYQTAFGAVNSSTYLLKNGTVAATGKLTFNNANLVIQGSSPNLSLSTVDPTSSMNVLINARTTVYSTAGGIDANINVNGRNIIKYNSDFSDTIQLLSRTTVHNVADPVAATDGANKRFVDTQFSTMASDNLEGPRHALAWAVISPSGSIQSSLNVASVTRTSNGQYDITLVPTTPIKGSNFLAMVSSLIHSQRTYNMQALPSDALDIIETEVVAKTLLGSGAWRITVRVRETQNTYTYMGGCDDGYTLERVTTSLSGKFLNDLCMVVYDLT